MNRSGQLLGAWCGFALTAIFAVGAVYFAKWIPPDIKPYDNAETVVAKLQEDPGNVRIGLTLMCISMCLLAPWGTSIAVQTRRTEGRFPILTYTQLTTLAASTALATGGVVCWAAAAYRPGGDAEISRFAIDLGWHFFYFAWPPFTFWCFSMGLAILWVRDEDNAFPRWSGFLSMWTGFLFIPAALITFFKDGPFAYNGIVAMWVPIIVFFIWIVAMSSLVIQNVRNGDIHDPEADSSEYDDALLIAAAERVLAAHGMTVTASGDSNGNIAAPNGNGNGQAAEPVPTEASS